MVTGKREKCAVAWMWGFEADVLRVDRIAVVRGSSAVLELGTRMPMRIRLGDGVVIVEGLGESSVLELWW